MENYNSKFQSAVLEFDIEKFLDESGYRFVHSGGGQLLFNCPFCGASNKFYLNIENKLWICFRCDERGNLVKLISEVCGLSAKESVLRIYGKRSGQWIQTRGSEILNYHKRVWSDEDEIEIPDFTFAVPIDQCTPNSAVHHYLHNRGITDDMIKKFQLRFTALFWRLVFPIFTESNMPYGWVARDITGMHPMKYLNNRGLKKSKILYGMNLHWNRESVIVVEGPVDAIKCYGHGGVALLGKTLSSDQLNILLSMPNLTKVYVGIDPDQPACARQIADILSSFFCVYRINFDSYRDLGDRSEDEIARMVSESVPHSKLHSSLMSFR